MAEQNCPNLADFLTADFCEENIAGTSSVAYLFLKDDLAAPLTRTKNVYSTPTFKSGKGLYKFELKDDVQQVQGESQGPNGGFNQTWNAALDKVNRKVSEILRAVNNLNIGVIIPDGEDNQILYDPNRRLKAESGGIKTDTGAKPGDERQTTLEFKLNGVTYSNFYVEAPEEGWDSLLASAAAVGG